MELKSIFVTGGIIVILLFMIGFYIKDESVPLVIGDSSFLFSKPSLNLYTGEMVKPSFSYNYVCIDKYNYELHLKVLPSAKEIKDFRIRCEIANG